MIDVRPSLAAALALGLVGCSSATTPNTPADATSALGADREQFDLGPGFSDAATGFPDALTNATDSGVGFDDAAEMVADAGDGICPPRGPFGVQMGQLLPDPPMVDCDGNPFSLHSFCERKAAWQFHLAGW